MAGVVTSWFYLMKENHQSATLSKTKNTRERKKKEEKRRQRNIKKEKERKRKEGRKRNWTSSLTAGVTIVLLNERALEARGLG